MTNRLGHWRCPWEARPLLPSLRTRRTAFNAVKTLEPDAKLSLAKLRTAAVPQLGNVLEASGASVKT